MNTEMSLDQILRETTRKLRVVSAETELLVASEGRILAEDIVTDRPSPACDVSAMDGYAIRLEDLERRELNVSGINFAGRPGQPWIDGQALKVFTGAPVPPQAECVIRREDTIESTESIQFRLPIKPMQRGENIRYRGENSDAGLVVLQRGTVLSAAQMASLVSFAPSKIPVRRKLRVAIINTGDELVEPGLPAEDWQIRDSNGPFLRSFLRRFEWVVQIDSRRISDDLLGLTAGIELLLKQADVILMTGGVSKGDSDYVPEAIKGLGGEVAFHGLPIRPGKPILAATWPSGQLVLGLPGNPLSVAVTARRFAYPLLLHMAGCERMDVRTGCVTLGQFDEKRLSLIWYRLVQLEEHGCQLVPSHGSGDVVSLGKSTGFIEVPPNQSGPGPWPYFAW